MTPLSWSAWLAATLPPRAPSLDQPARRPPDDVANMMARWTLRQATPPPDIVPDTD